MLWSLVSAINAFQFILSWVNREYIIRRSSSDRRAVRRGAGKHSMNSFESQSQGVQFLFRFLFEASEDLNKTTRALIPDHYSKLDDEMRLFTASLAHAKELARRTRGWGAGGRGGGVCERSEQEQIYLDPHQGFLLRWRLVLSRSYPRVQRSKKLWENRGLWNKKWISLIEMLPTLPGKYLILSPRLSWRVQPRSQGLSSLPQTGGFVSSDPQSSRWKFGSETASYDYFMYGKFSFSFYTFLSYIVNLFTRSRAG